MLLLSEKDCEDLAAEYVSRGLFYGVMSVWHLDGSKSGVETTEPMRRKVFDDLYGRDAMSRQILETKIAKKVVRMAASSHTGYRTVGEWREHLDQDEHLMDVLKECFDYMAVVVEAGVKKLWDAWRHVKECANRDVKGVWIWDRFYLEHTLASVSIGKQPIGAPYVTPEPGATETHRARCDFCDGKGLDHTNCGPLPLEDCTKLAVKAAEKIKICLDAHAKDNSYDNKQALCEALCVESNAELRAFMIEYQKCSSTPDVRAMLAELAEHADPKP
jgi:hypothetical protein